MKTYIPIRALVASLIFACANSFAQKPTPVPDIPKTPVAPRAVAVPAQDEVEAVAATEAALAAQDQALAAQNEALARVDEKLQTFTARAGHARSSTRSLVIPKDSADAKNLTDTEEDMSVMARILEKAANSENQKSEHSMGITVWGVNSSGTPKNLYIDGFGALFFLSVNYPLLPPVTKEQAAESKSEADTEWEKARNELYRPQGSGPDLTFNFTPFDSGSYAYSTGEPAEEYDEDKVTELKESLTAALKNAGHIRRLGGDD